MRAMPVLWRHSGDEFRHASEVLQTRVQQPVMSRHAMAAAQNSITSTPAVNKNAYTQERGHMMGNATPPVWRQHARGNAVAAAPVRKEQDNATYAMRRRL